MAVSWSVEEVQTFISLTAEERIQQELDGTTWNEKVCICTIHVYNPAQSKAVLNCSGNTKPNRAVPSCTKPSLVIPRSGKVPIVVVVLGC